MLPNVPLLPVNSAHVYTRAVASLRRCYDALSADFQSSNSGTDITNSRFESRNDRTHALMTVHKFEFVTAMVSLSYVLFKIECKDYNAD